MGAMAVESDPVESDPVQFARRRPFTVDDLEAMPDDGYRYELIDGMLFVSPAPDLHHQEMVGNLFVALKAACPSDMHVVLAPFTVQFSKTTGLQPDVLVGRKKDFTRKFLPVAPVLAVEVFSPSSRLNDLNTKKAVYEKYGAQSYWVIDPEAPALIAFELDDTGLYQTVAKVEGTNAFEARQPFPVRIVPAELLGWLADE